ncbi:MAG: tetratricopeptide repeat protein [Gemmatimonadota bacterium]
MLAINDDGGSALLKSAREKYQTRDYGAVVKLLGSVPGAQLIEEPEQGFMLADSARRVGGVTGLLELTGEVVAAARTQGRARVLCDALNLHGVLLFEQGHARAAERAWFELVSVATEADNPEFVARASNNLGVTAILSMRLEDAITSFQRAVSAYLRLGYARGLAQSHQNLGIVFRELGHDDESHAHFQRAMTWGYTADCMDDVARAEQELALLLLYSGRNVQAALASAQQALERHRQLGQPGATAEAQRVLGVVALAQGDLEGARTELEAALDAAREHQLRLLEAETLLALAVIADAPTARQQLEQQARSIFAAMDAQPWGEQVRKRMAALAA